MEKNHVLLIKCPDHIGLIAAITGVLFRNNHNILLMKEFVEPETNSFFARFELSGDLHMEVLHKELAAVLPATATVTINPKRNKDIVIMVTKEHHCLADLLVRHHFNELRANIKAVIGNYDVLKEFTQKFNLPFHFISHQDISRELFENEITQLLEKYQPDYLVLAKFMRVLSPQFVSKYEDRIINIHHSFLPAFIGANPYRKAYERGVKLIGATAHIVNNDLDEGPIITQKIIPVDHEYDVRGMVEAGHEVEKSVLADALRLVLEDRVFVVKNKTIIFN
ncbi:formyltetrahydrofolate deformylase [Foetidibacter luteolus]|uniref:formyltetrahydrofolate deformylase n=1 Tax=Foetidibacter luteolus TaxID=2608880 RepID=UPI00129BD3F7|nr:formyltetrahydrofolate deformylase [Foetidibacter luteolus]